MYKWCFYFSATVTVLFPLMVIGMLRPCSERVMEILLLVLLLVMMPVAGLILAVPL